MIKAIYTHASSKTGLISSRLNESSRWWLKVLDLSVTEESPYMTGCEKGVCRLFVDAASTPAHCAAVLCIDGRIVYTNAAPSSIILDQLAMRNDKQITSLVIGHAPVYHLLVNYITVPFALFRVAGDPEYISCAGNFR